MRWLFVTHPEVQVDPLTPVTRWRLSETGRARARSFAASGSFGSIQLLVSSAETKALETAAIIGSALGLPVAAHSSLGENDRSSTGFLPPAEFERTADQFFAHPSLSARGWETADDAQGRIVQAVRDCAGHHPDDSVALISHGAVGTLLLCSLLGVPIDRTRDQPRQGSWFTFDPLTWTSDPAWRELPDPAA